MKKWLVKEGDSVEQFQDLAEVATDKLFTQIPATEQAKIHKLHIKEGDACQVGGLLLELDVDDGVEQKDTGKPAQSHASSQSGTSNGSQSAAHLKSASLENGEKSLSTPAVREYAKQKGVNIHQVRVVIR